MSITSREDFLSYCLRSLGEPVIKINIDVDQAHDRIDEALSYYIQYHYDGTEREIVRVEADAAMVASKKLVLPKSVVSVLRVVPTLTEFEAALAGAPASRGQDGAISLNYYYGANAGGFSMSSYAASSIQMDVIRYLFRPERSITFRRAGTNTISFDTSTAMEVGDVFMVEVYQGIDPDTNVAVWDDMWLKEFATCLLKLQWGNNLSKFSGVQLPTGITLNADKIQDEARQEREKLLERLRNEYELPMDFYLG